MELEIIAKLRIAMKYAGLIFDESFHFIDHLAPFCASMGWPLIAFEESVAKLCRKFYPDLEVIEEPYLPTHVVTCDNRAFLKAAFPTWSPKTLWLPHGLSDKGWKQPFFEALGQEDLLLVYGQKMRDTLAAKQIAVPQFSIGNFRYEYYKKHRTFYDALLIPRVIQESVVEQEASSDFLAEARDIAKGKDRSEDEKYEAKAPPLNRLLNHERYKDLPRFTLYAPTWEDSENNGTFWDAFLPLAKTVPHLLVKVHPNTEKKFGPQLERMKGLAPHVHFLEEFPPIYPLLERVDLYIGDMSSIGYDFLTFNRPMIFFQDSPLTSAGTFLSIDEIPELFSKLQPAKSHTLLPYAFDSVPHWPEKLHTYLDA